MAVETLIHVIDDDEAVRASLGFLLGSAGYAVRSYASATEFLARLRGLEGHCIVTDVRMPGLSGVELLRQLKVLGVTLPTIVITGHGDIKLAVEAMKAGAADFIEKPFGDDSLLAAVRAAVSRTAAAQPRNPAAAEVAERLGALTRRELEVLKGLVAGKPNKIIAFDLGISPRTVEVYRANVMNKMKAGSLSDLVRLSLAAGLG